MKLSDAIKKAIHKALLNISFVHKYNAKEKAYKLEGFRIYKQPAPFPEKF